MFDKILMPIDLTHDESWKTALPMAKRCAGQDGEIHLLAILHDLGAAMVSSYLPKDFEKTAMEKLKSQLGDFAASEVPEAKLHVGHGHIAETILRIAGDMNADLIVMSSHPPNDFKTLLIGSNADKVVRHATRPVLVVR